MSRLILRKIHAAAATSERAEQLVCADGCGKVLHRDAEHMLVDIDAAALARLRDELPGWSVSESGAAIGLPDGRLKLRS